MTVQTTLRISDSQYEKLKDCKAEYRESADRKVSINKIILIAIKHFLAEDDHLAQIDNEVF